MQDFRSLLVWRRAHELTLGVYRATQAFPDHERFSLANQLRRAAASIPSNIAEGTGRRTDADFKRFIQVSISSACEVDYQLLLARDLGYVEPATHDQLSALCVEVRRMLIALAKRVSSHSP